MNLVENTQIVGGFVPLDLQVARTGQYVEIPAGHHLTIIFFKGTGTDGDDPIVTPTQATDAAGAGAKALNISRIWRKQAIDVLTVANFTLTTQAAGATYTNTDGHQQAIWILEYDWSDLDVAGGFRFARIALNDTGTNAQLACVLYIVAPSTIFDAPPTLRAIAKKIDDLFRKYIPQT